MITPTIGRIVIFVPPLDGSIPKMEDQNLSAIISYVWSDDMVNLAVFDANGNVHSRTSVPLIQEVNELSMDKQLAGYYCHWMPYQKGQAAKTEELEKKLSGQG